MATVRAPLAAPHGRGAKRVGEKERRPRRRNLWRRDERERKRERARSVAATPFALLVVRTRVWIARRRDNNERHAFAVTAVSSARIGFAHSVWSGVRPFASTALAAATAAAAVASAPAAVGDGGCASACAERR